MVAVVSGLWAQGLDDICRGREAIGGGGKGLGKEDVVAATNGFGIAR
jgi:hypothetical protein